MKNKQRKICVFSGKRGGFGAYVPLMRLIDKDKDLKLQILLGDMHASKEFGETKKEVRKLFPKAQIEIINMGTGRKDSERVRTENLGTCLHQSAKILEKLNPDIMMVHGDRGEHLVMALAALNLGMVVTHSQGGEVSGNIDDIQRHAITKLSHIHFAETKKSADRIKNLGEESWRIFNVGSIYLDRIIEKIYTPFSELIKEYPLAKKRDYAVVLFHPDTYESQKTNYQHAKNIFSAINSFELPCFVVYPCSDPGYGGIIKAIKEVKDEKQFEIHKNIDNLDFLGILDNAELLIGNSSAAMVEAPCLGLPAINIGRRQSDRDRLVNVIDSGPTVKEIKDKINFVLNDNIFRKKVKPLQRYFLKDLAAKKILTVLKTLKINEKLKRKKLSE